MTKNNTKLPNGSKAPAFLQMMQWIVNPLSMMSECAKRYGDIFTLCLGEKYAPVVFVSNPIALQEILTGDSTKQFSAPGEQNGIFEPLVGKYSLMTLSGVQHQRQRQLLTPPFHGERMRSYTQVISDITEEVMGELQIGKSFSVRDITQGITLRTIIKAVFGLYDDKRAKTLEGFLNAMVNNSSSLGGVIMLYFPVLQKDWGAWSLWGKHLRRTEQIDQLIYQEIESRRQEQADLSRTDILSLLMSARDEAGESMTDQELRDELLTLLIAGQETTATALAWALYWIHKLPVVQEKLLQEIDSLGQDIDATAINKLPYLNAVCCETLRIYPVGMLTFPRVVETPVNLCGYDLEPGTILYGNIYLTHHREDLYPEPHMFKPERFLARQFSPYEFLPFGGGVRRCIGAAFAMFEMKVALVKILSECSLALTDNRDVKAGRRGLVTAPASPIKMVVTGKRISSTTSSVDKEASNFSINKL
ncbi:cytochrome P450 [Dulcicalothrix desertica PCC 7102]|uniref:Cytochrome P450 n=1 Tax=Dulcicalothrix desertica PCC 7102 TaxID=232991 RepID=A0A433VBE1_9CYAN|nr:cytochrome P450 [Dulcicalothrix desertica]RUT03421.1 cytochrome P450 [Dulcicalothrix desertica PCC 7102]TWH50655.1 cytochrome P450 [Dulcicalothrix desertica PCC 7102]